VVALFALLLIIFLAAFFGLDLLTGPGAGGDIYIATVQNNDVFLSSSGIRVFLVGGILFFEFVIIVASLFDRMLNTIRVIIRPLITLIPLSAFLYSAYQTFYPIIKSLVPIDGEADPGQIAEIVNNSGFNSDVLQTIGTMLLYLIVAKVIGRGMVDADEVRAMRAELRRYRKNQGLR
jgi:hypothetical protein